jgi:glycosyltransferase involved in cell wall biosynthesis
MTSLTEGLPITLLEAMSLRTPVVASAVGDIPRVLSNGQGGELLGDIEPATILRAIAKSISDKEGTEEKTAYAYQNMASNYSSKAMSAKYLEFYNQILTN